MKKFYTLLAIMVIYYQPCISADYPDSYSTKDKVALKIAEIESFLAQETPSTTVSFTDSSVLIDTAVALYSKHPSSIIPVIDIDSTHKDVRQALKGKSLPYLLTSRHSSYHASMQEMTDQSPSFTLSSIKQDYKQQSHYYIKFGEVTFQSYNNLCIAKVGKTNAPIFAPLGTSATNFPIILMMTSIKDHDAFVKKQQDFMVTSGQFDRKRVIFANIEPQKKYSHQESPPTPVSSSHQECLFEMEL